ncbi:MAG: hypothetical protein V4580_16960 [Bacteroidota bacterium]
MKVFEYFLPSKSIGKLLKDSLDFGSPQSPSIQMTFSSFFFLDEKESKNQGKRPTPICPAMASPNGGSLSFAKSSRTITNVCSGVYYMICLFLNNKPLISTMKIKARFKGPIKI